MSNGIESLELGRDWFNSVGFSGVERNQILGNVAEQHSLQQAQYNWMSEFLYHEVGLHEEELSEWFRSSMPSLGHQTPLAVWHDEDGFDRVYDVAQEWREHVVEDLQDNMTVNQGRTILPTPSEQQNMKPVADIFRGLLIACGVEVEAEEASQRQGTIWNGQPDDDLFSIRFMGEHGVLEGYKVNMSAGRNRKFMHLLLLKEPVYERQVVQAAIHETTAGNPEDDIHPTDHDPFPKRSEAEPFVRRARECLRKGQLVKV